MARSQGRQAVFIGVLPEGFKPQRPWDIPPGFASVELYAKNLPNHHAAGFVRTHNKKQLAEGLPGRRWAFWMKHVKCRRSGEHPDARRARKAGAA
jgi:hypothetical protein